MGSVSSKKPPEYFEELSHEEIEYALQKCKDFDAFFVRYMDSQKKNFDIIIAHGTGQHTLHHSRLSHQEISMTISTKDGWIQLQGNFFTKKQLRKELQKDKSRFDGTTDSYKYMRIPSFRLLKQEITHHKAESGSSRSDYRYSNQPFQCSDFSIDNHGLAILDFSWREEIQKYKKINIVAVDCPTEICDAIRRSITDCEFVEEKEEADVTVVLTRKITRVQSDAERAMESANITQDEQKPVILMMFEAVVGNKTVDDVKATFYSCPHATKTFHVPYKNYNV